MSLDTTIDPLKIAADRADRDHLFRGLSIYRRVGKLNDIAGYKPKQPADAQYWESLKAQQELIQTKLDEVFESIERHDQTSLRDNMVDMEIMLQGMFYRGSLPYMRDVHEVLEASITGFCTTEEDVRATVLKYSDLGVETYVRTDDKTGYNVVFSAKDQVGLDGRFYPEGKWVKSAWHREPEYQSEY